MLLNLYHGIQSQNPNSLVPCFTSASGAATLVGAFEGGACAMNGKQHVFFFVPAYFKHYER